MPTVFFSLAALLMAASIPFPYWHMDMKAPQYPKGLVLQAYVNKMTGDVEELDRLNHYIGMRPLADAAQFEMSIAVVAIVLMAALAILASIIHTRWAVLMCLPAITFPFVFLADMWWTMRDYGLNLDPDAPLSNSIKPFVPTVLGAGEVAQFETYAYVLPGFWLAVTGVVLILVGLVFHRAAWKPLVDRGNGEPVTGQAAG